MIEYKEFKDTEHPNIIENEIIVSKDLSEEYCVCSIKKSKNKKKYKTQLAPYSTEGYVDFYTNKELFEYFIKKDKTIIGRKVGE